MIRSRNQLPPELESSVRRVAARLRRRDWLRGLARFGLASLVLTSVFTFLLAGRESLGVERNALLLGFAVVELILFLWIVLRSSRAKPSMRQVALYIEEHHPDLENRILSAVEFTSGDQPGASEYLIRKCLEDSESRIGAVRIGEVIDARLLVRAFSLVLFFFMLTSALILSRLDLWRPEQGGISLSRSKPAAELSFTVDPGNARVRVGENQVVLVRSERVGARTEIRWKSGEGEWTAATMPQGSTEKVRHHEFTDIREDIHYQVTSGGETSDIYLLETWLPPRVESIDVTYHYPEYLGWPDREVPNSGNLTAVEGTEAELAVRANKRLASAEIVLKSGERIPLRPAGEFRWTAAVPIESDDRYHVALVDDEDLPSEFDPEYRIVAQRDKAPKVKIDFPRGDAAVTSVEEVPFTFAVEDDFGLADFGLQFEIVGQEPVRVPLAGEDFDPNAAGGEHMIPLEEMKLTAGDLITWSVWARDGKPDRADTDENGDLYFLEIRPFFREYEESVSADQAAGQGMSGGAGEAGDQKEIVLALWNLRRRASSLERPEFEEQREVISSAQHDIMSKLQGMAQMAEGAAPPELDKALEAMAAVVEAVGASALPDPRPELGRAIENAQTAYRWLLKMQPDRSQVTQAQQGQGGGGAQQNDQGLLENLEFRRNRNFYEEERTTQAEREAVDQTLSRIKELARRQQLINKEIARLISELNKAKTEEERREIERQLEQLRKEEERNLERLDQLQSEVAESEMSGEQRRETSSGLQEAREQMNRSLENMNSGQMQQARLSGSRALDSLSEIEEKLQNLSRGAAAERMAELQERMDEMRSRQEEILDSVRKLQGEGSEPSLRRNEADERIRQELLDGKEHLEREFTRFMNDAGDLAERSAQTQELMSRRLGDWLRDTSSEGILEDMEESEPLVRYGIWDAVRGQEEQVAEKLAAAASQLDRVSQAMVGDDVEGMQKALDELEEILNQARARESAAGDPSEERTGGRGERGEMEIAGLAPDDRMPGRAGGMERPDGTPEDRARSDEANRRGMQLAREGDLDAAESEFESAVAADPSNADARENLRRVRRAMRDDENAEAGSGQAAGERPGPEAGGEEAGGEEAGGEQPVEQPGGRNPGEESGRSESGPSGAEQGEPGQGERPGQSESPGQSGSSPGSEPGESPGSEASPGSPGDQAGGPQGDARPSASGGGGSPQTGLSQPQPGGPQRGGAARGGERRGGFAAGPEFGPDGFRPEDLERMIGEDYQDWSRRLRDAEALLPADGPFREDLKRIRAELEGMRRDYTRHSLAPQFDLFLGDVLNPLSQTAASLEREIMKVLQEKEFILTDEGEIPAQYRRHVSRYFEDLSQVESAREPDRAGTPSR